MREGTPTSTLHQNSPMRYSSTSRTLRNWRESDGQVLGGQQLMKAINSGAMWRMSDANIPCTSLSEQSSTVHLTWQADLHLHFCTDSQCHHSPNIFPNFPVRMMDKLHKVFKGNIKEGHPRYTWWLDFNVGSDAYQKWVIWPCQTEPDSRLAKRTQSLETRC